MDNLQEPLTEQELSRLDDFLLDRFDDEEKATDSDEGILNVSELDGFLTAVVSGPDVVPPSEWLPLVWGEEEPVWKSVDDFQQIFGLMVRHMNSIVSELMMAPDEFEPVFLEHTVEGQVYTVVDDWCSGYLRGVQPCLQAWVDEAPESYDLLAPIFVFGHERGWEFTEGMEISEEERLQQEVAPAVRAIHAYWLAKRSTSQVEPLGHKRAQRVGRNQPCPCGSGLKYKRCCMQ